MTGTGPAFTDNLRGLTVVSLTGVSATSNFFKVSGWTGSGSLSAPAGTGTLRARKSASFFLTDTSVSSTDGMALGLSGITTANLTDSGGTQTFTITGWSGDGTLSGSNETLVDSVSTSLVLANTSLAVTGLPTLTLSGFKTANLTDTAGGNTFTVSGWTGSGTLTDSAATADTVAASKSAAVTLSDGLMTAGTMSLTLNGITTANLIDTGGGHTFTVSGWTGTGSLTDSATVGDTVTASKNAGFTLTNTSLSSTDGMTLGVSGIIHANLTDTSSGNTFTITGWTGNGSLTGTADALVDTVAANTTLTNASLVVSGLPTLTLSGLTVANLTDTTGGNTFTVSGWTGAGSLTDSSATGDIVTARKSASFTLTDTSLSSTDGMSLGLGGIATANLTDSGGSETFTITGWSGDGTLKGSNETLVDSVTTSLVLANTSLAVTGLPTVTLSGFKTANLTDTAGGNTFTVSGWTGSGTLTDSAAAADTVAASKSAAVTLSDAPDDGGHHVTDVEWDHNGQPDRHRWRSHLYCQWLDGNRLAHRQRNGRRHGHRKQERGLHVDQHFALLHRWYDLGRERDHSRQPHGHQQRQHLHDHRLDGERVADRYRRRPG